jgi:hypothetical protein
MFKCDEGMCKWPRTNFRCPITGANKDNMEVHEHVNTNISHLKKKLTKYFLLYQTIFYKSLYKLQNKTLNFDSLQVIF